MKQHFTPILSSLIFHDQSMYEVCLADAASHVDKLLTSLILNSFWIEWLAAKWCEGTCICVNNRGPGWSSKRDLLTWI